jgi:hypothetical protein
MDAVAWMVTMGGLALVVLTLWFFLGGRRSAPLCLSDAPVDHQQQTIVNLLVVRHGAGAPGEVAAPVAQAFQPPSTLIVAPVIYVAPGPARKTAIAAISSGRP